MNDGFWIHVSDVDKVFIVGNHCRRREARRMTDVGTETIAWGFESRVWSWLLRGLRSGEGGGLWGGH